MSSAPRSAGAVELDRAAAPADLAGQRDASRLAVDEELGADLESLRILARLLDDERAVDAVRPTDPADANELGARAQSAISST